MIPFNVCVYVVASTAAAAVVWHVVNLIAVIFYDYVYYSLQAIDETFECAPFRKWRDALAILM